MILLWSFFFETTMTPVQIIMLIRMKSFHSLLFLLSLVVYAVFTHRSLSRLHEAVFRAYGNVRCLPNVTQTETHHIYFRKSMKLSFE